MKISDLEFHLVQLRTSATGGTGAPQGNLAANAADTVLLVRLITDEQLEGWGEAVTRWRRPELVVRREHILPLVAGRSVFDIEELLALEGLEDNAFRFALETACWDVVGRIVGQPLCHLWGGVYRDRIPLAVRLAPGDAEAMACAARELLESGFTTQVFGATGDPEQDAARAAAIRDLTGGRVEVRIDGAGRFDAETARELCAHLETLGSPLLFDPLPSTDLNDFASLQRQVNTPLVVWRAIHGPEDVLALIRAGGIEHVIIDPAAVGGISRARSCAAVCQAGHIVCMLATGPSLGPAAAAVFQLSAATPAFSNGNECPIRDLFETALAGPWELGDGMVHVPNAPGLGVEVDPLRLEEIAGQ